MQVKIDTKEKFVVVTPIQPEFTAKIADELHNISLLQLQQVVKNIVLNFEHVQTISEALAGSLAELQQKVYENNASFVICCMQPAVQKVFDKLDLLDFLNSTPTESEAWDIIQMEEIERELLNGEM